MEAGGCVWVPPKSWSLTFTQGPAYHHGEALWHLAGCRLCSAALPSCSGRQTSSSSLTAPGRGRGELGQPQPHVLVSGGVCGEIKTALVLLGKVSCRIQTFLILFCDIQSLFCPKDSCCSVCVHYLFKTNKQAQSLVKYVGMTLVIRPNHFWIAARPEHTACRGTASGQEGDTLWEEWLGYQLLYSRNRKMLFFLLHKESNMW